MYRLLLPGICIKRWVLVNVAGMLVFAAGATLLLPPGLPLQGYLWALWFRITGQEISHTLLAALGVCGLLAGIGLVGWGTQGLVCAFAAAANPQATGWQLMRRLLDRHRSAELRVVGLGGGTGLSTLLRGLKTYPLDLTAVVTVSDDGGSSGRLRSDLDMPPPGDIRHCLVALAETEPLMERLFEHRFAGESDLSGHSLGNLIIAGLRDMTGDFEEAIQEASRVLAVRGRVLPSADRALVLKAVLADGRTVVGETAIVAEKAQIVSLAVDPPDVPPLPATLEALREADVIIVGPGSVYSSLLPNLLIPGVAEAIRTSSALKFFICNVMTQVGETDHFAASRHLEAVLEHLPGGRNLFDYMVVNLQRPSADVVRFYAEKGQEFVDPDLARIRGLGSTPVTGNLLADIHLARHDPDKLAACILETITRAMHSPKVLNRR